MALVDFVVSAWLLNPWTFGKLQQNRCVVSRLYGITTATPAALGQTGGDFLAVPRGRTGLGRGWMRNPGGGRDETNLTCAYFSDGWEKPTQRIVHESLIFYGKSKVDLYGKSL